MPGAGTELSDRAAMAACRQQARSQHCRNLPTPGRQADGLAGTGFLPGQREALLPGHGIWPARPAAGSPLTISSRPVPVGPDRQRGEDHEDSERPEHRLTRVDRDGSAGP